MGLNVEDVVCTETTVVLGDSGGVSWAPDTVDSGPSCEGDFVTGDEELE